VQLAQQPELPQIEHRSAQLTDIGKQRSLDLNASRADTPSMTSTARTHPDAPLAVRRATDADAAALRDLARVDSAHPLSGDVVVAARGGAPGAPPARAAGPPGPAPGGPPAAARAVLAAYAARVAAASAPRRSAWSRPPQRRHLQAAA
jgi:hypothetical protein